MKVANRARLLPSVEGKYWLMNIEDLFFQLLQMAIGTRNILDRQPTSREWALLFNMSKKHALVAVAFAGVNRLKEVSSSRNGFGNDIGIDEMLYLKWLGLTAKVVQRNKAVTSDCERVARNLAHDGMKCCILKGQSNLEYYPENLREYRTSGDIDVLIRPMEKQGIAIAVADLDGKSAHYEYYSGERGAIEYVKMLYRLRHKKVEELYYHHLEMPMEKGETEVEAHHKVTWMDSPLRNWRLQRWMEDNEPFGKHDSNVFGCTFPTPTVSFNAVYQLCHIYRHMFEEGIGLRQLLDYYFVLRALHIEQGELADRTQSMAQWAEGMGVAVASNEEIMNTLGRFGMKKFAGAVMWVLQTVFEAPLNSLERGKRENTDRQTRYPWMICEPNEKEGKFLLNEIMMAGNFGKYDPRMIHNSQFMIHNWEKLKHNLRLLTHYPEEVLWEPFFRLYHWAWRKLELWRY